MCPLTPRCREARVADPARELRSRSHAKHSWSGLLGRISPERLAPGLALDLGCGSGADSIVLAEQGFTVLGLDFSTTAITGVSRHGSVLIMWRFYATRRDIPLFSLKRASRLGAPPIEPGEEEALFGAGWDIERVVPSDAGSHDACFVMTRR